MLTELTDYASALGVDVDIVAMLKFIGLLAAAMLLVGVLGRVLLGKRSGLNHAVSSAMGILCIYALTIVVYTFNPYELSKFLAPLPFVTFSGETLTIFSFAGAGIPAVCTQVLSMLILAFLVNLLDGLLPRGKGLLGWYGFRFLTVILSMGLHFLVSWAFNLFLPGVLVTYAPAILVGLLAVLLIIGVLNILLSLVLTVVNPIFGAVYAFFFSNKIGKQVSKAVVTTLVLCGVVLALNRLGYAVVSISASALGAYVPLIVVLLILWYLLGHIL